MSTDRFDGYEAELRLVQADINQKLDSIPSLSGEERKKQVSQASSSLDEAKELLESMNLEKSSLPANARSSLNTRFRNHQTDVDNLSRRLATLSSDRSALFGSRYKDEPAGDEHYEQRQQLLSGTDRLARTGDRLSNSQRIANDTEDIGAGVLRDLAAQREVIVHAHNTLGESEQYTDRSASTLRTMARRMATNRIITISIITVLVILIILVIVNKFR